MVSDRERLCDLADGSDLTERRAGKARDHDGYIRVLDILFEAILDIPGKLSGGLTERDHIRDQRCRD